MHHLRLSDYVANYEGEAIFMFLKSVWEQMKMTVREGLSMEGILVLAPSISHLLQNVSGYFPEFLDFSVVPSLIFANDMGGAHLAHDLSSD